MRHARALGIAALVLVPAGVAAMQLAQVADSTGCPSRLVPSTGPVRLRVFVENPVQGLALQPRALESYLGDRFGRPFQVLGVEQADETGFRLAAATDPLSNDVLVFFGYRTSFPNVETAHGLVDALGFATPGTACAYVSFLPQEPSLCQMGLGVQPVQPAYAYLAHEVGHLMGLSHSINGIMGAGVFQLCSGDHFTAPQLQALRAWGA